MGKRIIQQARGHGSLTYRVKKKAFRYESKYPTSFENAEVIDIINSPAHSAPLAKIRAKVGDKNKVFYVPAAKMLKVGYKLNEKEIASGDIRELKDIPIGKSVFNIETRPRDGGKLIKTAGANGQVVSKSKNLVEVLMPSKKKKKFNEKCRATIGVVAGAGRLDKPICTAGKKYHMKKGKSKLWPRTSAVKMNAIDHPFGSGRGKRIKSKIAKRNAPAGRKVGLLRPRRTGKRK